MYFRQLRKRAGVKQKDIAREFGISSSAVSSWEHGKSCPGADKLPKLEKMLGVSSSVILRAIDESKSDDEQPINANLFSTDELQAVAAFFLEKVAEIEKEMHYDVKRLEVDEIYQKYLSIARKAQVNLIDQEFQERRAKGGRPIEPGAEGERL